MIANQSDTVDKSTVNTTKSVRTNKLARFLLCNNLRGPSKKSKKKSTTTLNTNKNGEKAKNRLKTSVDEEDEEEMDELEEQSINKSNNLLHKILSKFTASSTQASSTVVAKANEPPNEIVPQPNEKLASNQIVQVS